MTSNPEPRVPLKDALQFTSLPSPAADGSVTAVSWTPSPQWVIGRAPFGGYVTAAVLRAGLQHSHATDPAHLDIHFFAPNTPGVPVTITATTLKRARLSVVNIECTQHGHVTVLALLIVTDYAREALTGVTRITEAPTPRIHTDFVVPPMPPRNGITHVLGLDIRRDMSKGFTPQNTNPERIEVDHFYRLNTNEPWDVITAAMLGDPVYPFVVDPLGLNQYWFPTVALSIQFRRHPPKDCQWLRQICRSRFTINSRGEIDSEVYDEEGNIILNARQTFLWMTWEQNQRSAKRRGAPPVSRNTKITSSSSTTSKL